MSKIYKVVSKEYVSKILSEQRISMDYVDSDSIQDFNDFVKFRNPSIQYNVSDFLFSLSKEVENIFSKNKWIDLSAVNQFGWYYSKIHKAEFQIFDATSPNKLRMLYEINPLLKIESFDKYRCSYRPLKATNVLNGALGLSYLVFKDDYDNFFRKIKIHNDHWIINKSDLEKLDYPILSQIFLYYNAETNNLRNNLFNNDELKGVLIYSFFLEKSFSYFINNDYSMDNFLSNISSVFGKYKQLKIFADEFKKLNEKYVKRGLSFSTQNPITNAAKEFIDLAKTESGNLKNILKQNDLNKTAVFLLGMLNLGDRIDDQFNFDIFIPSIVDLTMRHIVDVSVSNKEIIILFDNKIIGHNRNNKFDYVQNYFNELHKIYDVSVQLNELNDKYEILKKNYSMFNNINDLKNDIGKLVLKKDGLQTQQNALEEEIQETSWYNEFISNYKNSDDEKSNLQKQLKIVQKNIKDLSKTKSSLEMEEKKISKEIKLLRQKIKSHKDEKDALASKEDSKKSSDSAKKEKQAYIKIEAKTKRIKNSEPKLPNMDN